MRLDKVGESKGDVDLFESTPYADSIAGHEAFYHTKATAIESIHFYF